MGISKLRNGASATLKQQGPAGRKSIKIATKIVAVQYIFFPYALPLASAGVGGSPEKQFELHLFQISPGAKTSTHGFHDDFSHHGEIHGFQLVPSGPVSPGTPSWSWRADSPPRRAVCSPPCRPGKGLGRWLFLFRYPGPIAGVLVVYFMENGGFFLWKIPKIPKIPILTCLFGK